MSDPAATTHHAILIIDFGSQVTQLIARRVREAGAYSEIVPFDKASEAFSRLKPKGVILSGGPGSVPQSASPRQIGWRCRLSAPYFSESSCRASTEVSAFRDLVT